MSRFRHPALALALLAFVPSSRALNLRLEATTIWAENVSRSAAQSDWRDAWTHEAGASLGMFREWRTGFITSGEISARAGHTPAFPKLDVFSFGPSVQLRQKFGLGAFAPSLAIDGGIQNRQARLDAEDGWTATAGLSFTKRLTHSWRATVTGDWQQHYAGSSIFDTRHHRFFGFVTWDVNNRWQLSLGGGRLWGDFAAAASWAVWERALAGALGTPISEYYNTVSWGVTELFGPDWVSYRVRGRVSFWWLELSPAIGRNTSLPLRYESRFSVNKVGVKYRQDLWSLQVLHRF
ncbi:MAG: hypothetical protein WD941_03285 [Opitutus sp.]